MTEPTKEDVAGRKEPSGGNATQTQNAEGNASLPSSGGLIEKLNILEGEGWMKDYDAKMVSPFEYAVLSLNNGQPSQHYVNLRDRTCTCEDKTYNVDRAAGMCRHQLYCMVREDKPSERDTALLAVVAHGSHIMASEAKRLTRAATGHEADAQADAGGSAGPTPAEAQTALRTAVESKDGVNLKDITTGEYEGDDQVWFKMGAEDFDWLKSVTSEHDLVGFNGEWNTVNVEDVDDYISGVLE